MDTTTTMFDDVKFSSANNNDHRKLATLTHGGDGDFRCKSRDVGNKSTAHKNDDVKLYYEESPENDDEDDDVFASEDPEDGLSKPLMYPRQRAKVKTVRPVGKPGKLLRCAACILLVVGLIVASGWLIVYVHRHDKFLFQRQNHSGVIGCSYIEVEDVWITKLPKLTTESALRMLDVNNDNILDVILGFATGANGEEEACVIYFNKTRPCQGGLLALDGTTGQEIWRHYAAGEIFALNCDEDLNSDGLSECLASGRAGTLEAVDMKDGRTLWTFDKTENKDVRVGVMNVYTSLYVTDLDEDGVADIVIMHGGDPLAKPGQTDRLPGHLVVLSGHTGRVLQWVATPDGHESYYSPVMTVRRDGTPMILFGTGGETNGGALWHITLGDLYKGNIGKARAIYTDAFKGMMTPPALVDITGDGVCDIVFASFNATVVAIDGDTYKVLWTASFPSSETYATPAPGFYNDDDVPDFLIHYQRGPGYPVYYDAITTVLDGQTGQPLVKPYLRSTVGTQVSPLTVAMEGEGNDLFLHWLADCEGHEGEGTPFRFPEGTDPHAKSHADLCQLRFGSNAVNRLHALGQHVTPPGGLLYDSAKTVSLETQGWVDTVKEGEKYLRTHPNLQVAAPVLHQTQDSKKPAATAQHQYFSRMHPGVSGRKHLPRFRERPAKSQTGTHARLEPPRQEPNQYTQPYRNYERPDTNQDYLSRYGNRAGQQRLDDDPYPQTAGFAGQYGGQNNYPKRQDYQPMYDSRYAVKKRNGEEGGWTDDVTAKGRGRKKRDVETSAGAGTVQRSISTGTLAPSSLPPSHPDYPHSIDLVFSTYRFLPVSAVVILPTDQSCIDQMMAAIPFQLDQADGADADTYRQRVVKTCVEKRTKGTGDSHSHSDGDSDRYHLQMGQITVYRIQLKCTCETNNATNVPETCGQVLPYDQQPWSAYMGSKGTGHWRPPPRPLQ